MMETNKASKAQGWEWPKKKNTENNILVPKAFVWAVGLGALPQENFKK